MPTLTGSMSSISARHTFLTKSGLTKRRTNRGDKIVALDPTSTAEVVRSRLDDFISLFAPRRWGAITTRVETEFGGGTRSWTQLRGSLTIDHVVRHLLGDRLAGLRPLWFGARSFSTTKWFC